jgi:Protein of unknown function (DUF4232)
MSPLSRLAGRQLPGRYLTVGAAAICAALLIPAAALGAAPHPDGTTPGTAAVAPTCGYPHPAIPGGAFVWSGNPGNGFAGGQVYQVEITNVGKKACSLKGVPALAAVRTSNGHLVGAKIPASSKGPRITLKPHATAHIELTIHIPAMCTKPVNAEAVVYLPGQKRAQDTYLGAQACPGFAGGGVLVSTHIEPGTGIPLYSN